LPITHPRIEGSTANFTITTSNVNAGTSIAYTLSGVTSSDIAGGALTGFATVNSSGTATVSVPVAADSLTEGTESLTITAQGKSASVLINDTSVNTAKPNYILFSDASSFNEGSVASFNLTTTNLSAGTVLNYTLEGVGADDIVGGSLVGTLTINAHRQSCNTNTLGQ